MVVKFEKRSNPNMYEGAIHVITKAVNVLRKPAVMMIVLGFLLVYSAALALSGGGGSFSDHYASDSDYDSDGDDCLWTKGFFVTLFILISFLILVALFGANGCTSVMKLQVCLFGSTKSLQKDLNWIAESADTSGPQGWNYILKETANTLLQCPDWCIAAHSSVDVKISSTEGKTLFEKLSIEEREKFDKETLVDLDNTKRNNTSRQSDNEVSSDYIVVTVLVVAKGTHMLPSVKSGAELKEALEKLYLISTEQTTAVQVLWAPQEENDTLSEQELHEKYPLLSVLSKSHAHDPENVSDICGPKSWPKEDTW